MNGKQDFARAISIVLHPVSSVAFLVALSAREGNRLLPMIALAALVAVPLVVFSRRQVRRGAWENVDASRPAERHALFLFAGISVLLLAAWFYANGAREHAVGTFAALVMGAVAYALLRWIKLSLHMAFCTYAAGVLLAVRPAGGWLLVAALPLLAWSRLALGRHTRAEVAGGTLLGALTAVIVTLP